MAIFMEVLYINTIIFSAFSFFNYKDAYKLINYIGIDIKMSEAFIEKNKKDSWSSV